MPFNIGPGELILILIIALVVLGPGKLPDVANSLGKSVREFRKAATDITDAGKLDASATTPSTDAPAAQVAPPAGPPPVAPPPPPVDPTAPTARADDDPETAPAGSPARDPNLS
jgi:sec-independent protein translocase protein TatA